MSEVPPPAEPAPSSASLRRDLDILDLLASAECRRRGGLGVVRIAERLGRENSQVSRALRALALAGMVERNPQTLDYRLGWRLYAYAARTFEAWLVHIAGPFIRRLVAGLQETTHLCVLRGNQVLTLWTESPVHAYRALTWEGMPVPVIETSAGRALIAQWEPDVVRQWFADDLATAGGQPRLRTADQLADELAAIRKRGYALVRDELEVGVVSCAAVVEDFRHQAVAAVSVSGPQHRLGTRLDRAGLMAARAAADISRAIRHGSAPR